LQHLPAQNYIVCEADGNTVHDHFV
jgi:hypothetical protein